jgi:hypothetical protein
VYNANDFDEDSLTWPQLIPRGCFVLENFALFLLCHHWLALLFSVRCSLVTTHLHSCLLSHMSWFIDFAVDPDRILQTQDVNDDMYYLDDNTPAPTPHSMSKLHLLPCTRRLNARFRPHEICIYGTSFICVYSRVRVSSFGDLPAFSSDTPAPSTFIEDQITGIIAMSSLAVFIILCVLYYYYIMPIIFPPPEKPVSDPESAPLIPPASGGGGAAPATAAGGSRTGQ